MFKKNKKIIFVTQFRFSTKSLRLGDVESYICYGVKEQKSKGAKRAFGAEEATVTEISFKANKARHFGSKGEKVQHLNLSLQSVNNPHQKKHSPIKAKKFYAQFHFLCFL